MRRGLLVIVSLFVFVLPITALADCSSQGYNIVYVNGILTSSADANSDVGALQKQLGTAFGGQSLNIHLGYNPSHLDGYGDEVESVSQAFGAPISNYDLDTLLGQLAQEVTTRKLLLVGHSQGTFYANEMYDYLVNHGAPPQSVAVYNLATPASAVEGGGTYLTSGNDKLVNQVRVWDAEADVPGPLPANILIPPQPGDDADIYGGHHFQGDYLAGAATHIVSDIKAALAKLLASNTDSTPCFTPPPLGLADQAQKVAFALADPAVAGLDITAGKAAHAAGAVASAVVSAGNALTQTVNNSIADAFFSIFPKPDAQSAGTAFAVEKALYGSSLSEADYEALLQGKDIPEDEPAPPPSQPRPTPIKTNVETPPEPLPVAEAQPQPSQAPPQPPIPPAPQPVLASISLSPGFGGGAPASAAVQIPAAEAPQSDSPQTEATSSLGNEQPPSSQDQATSTSDETTDTASSTSPTATSTPDIEPPPALASCGQETLSTTGDFFSDAKDDAKYLADGYLEYHFKNAKNGGFRLSFSYYDDECGNAGPLAFYTPLQVGLPTGDFDWSVRFTSQTHFDVWDDDNDTMLGSVDLHETMPSYTSISFKGSSANGDGTFTSRGLKIFGQGEPPTFTNSVPTPAGCPNITASGYFFDPSYQNTEYVDGLLRVHLRLLAPYNDGRSFKAKVLTIGSDCSFPAPSFSVGPPETSLTPFIRYYSFRMASSTHWLLWNDENDTKMQCGGACEGDIPDATSFVSFFASVDGGASTLRTTPFPPTGH